jgi:hypothetical protein
MRQGFLPEICRIVAARVDTLALKSDPTRGVRRSAPLNPFQQLRQLGDLHRNPLRSYCCFFFEPATVGGFGLGVLGVGRMAAQGSFAF